MTKELITNLKNELNLNDRELNALDLYLDNRQKEYGENIYSKCMAHSDFIKLNEFKKSYSFNGEYLGMREVLKTLYTDVEKAINDDLEILTRRYKA